ncbi:MAG: macro domain-containing protein [Actinobacteria bacterium]|nr:macro domain-containing protein [Actinomycetota bacterium]
MKEYKLGSVNIQIVKGDITEQKDMEAIVNSANPMLAPGGGVAGAIHRAAGPELYDECKKFAPIKVGSAVITSGYRLPNRYVIHTLGPRYGIDKPEDDLLAKCFESSLRIAESNGINSIAFPAISTGIFGYPVEEAAIVSLKTIKRMVPHLRNIRTIRIVLYSEGDYLTFLKAAEEILTTEE